MNIKHILLSERIQSQKALYCLILFIIFSKRQNYRAGEQIGGCQGVRGGVDYKGKWKEFLKGYGMISYLDHSGGYTTLCIWPNL